MPYSATQPFVRHQNTQHKPKFGLYCFIYIIWFYIFIILAIHEIPYMNKALHNIRILLCFENTLPLDTNKFVQRCSNVYILWTLVIIFDLKGRMTQFWVFLEEFIFFCYILGSASMLVDIGFFSNFFYQNRFFLNHNCYLLKKNI